MVFILHSLVLSTKDGSSLPPFPKPLSQEYFLSIKDSHG